MVKLYRLKNEVMFIVIYKSCCFHHGSYLIHLIKCVMSVLFHRCNLPNDKFYWAYVIYCKEGTSWSRTTEFLHENYSKLHWLNRIGRVAQSLYKETISKFSFNCRSLPITHNCTCLKKKRMKKGKRWICCFFYQFNDTAASFKREVEPRMKEYKKVSC